MFIQMTLYLLTLTINPIPWQTQFYLSKTKYAILMYYNCVKKVRNQQATSILVIQETETKHYINNQANRYVIKMDVS